MKSSIIILFCFLSLKLLAILPDPVKEFNYEKMKLFQDTLASSFSSNKCLVNDFVLQSLIALSYYPELENHSIDFALKNIKTTMQCVPRIDFLFKEKTNRIYMISIDDKVKNRKGLLLKDVPFNAQIGVIGHELAHVVDYDSKSKMGIVFLGIGYLFHNKRREVENRVDEITIAHGLGNQVKDFSDFVFNNDNLNEHYLKYKQKFYYNPGQLMQIMMQYPIYRKYPYCQ